MKKIDNLKVRKVKVNVKETLIENEEYFVVDEEGNEDFNRNIEI